VILATYNVQQSFLNLARNDMSCDLDIIQKHLFNGLLCFISGLRGCFGELQMGMNVRLVRINDPQA
jgi:hypothetical protein